MMDQIQLLRVHSDDRTKFMQMSLFYYQELDPDFHPTEEWQNTYFETVTQDPTMELMWVVKQTSNVGFVLLGRQFHRFRPQILIGHIHEYYIEPEFRGSHVATTGAQLAIQRLKELGCTRVQLEVLANNDRARKFWSKVGFAKHSERYILSER